MERPGSARAKNGKKKGERPRGGQQQTSTPSLKRENGPVEVKSGDQQGKATPLLVDTVENNQAELRRRGKMIEKDPKKLDAKLSDILTEPHWWQRWVTVEKGASGLLLNQLQNFGETGQLQLPWLDHQTLVNEEIKRQQALASEDDIIDVGPELAAILHNVATNEALCLCPELADLEIGKELDVTQDTLMDTVSQSTRSEADGSEDDGLAFAFNLSEEPLVDEFGNVVTEPADPDVDRCD